MLNRVSCVSYIPAWSTSQRANVPKACQLLIFTCQRANKRAKGVPIFRQRRKACQFFKLACQHAKDVPFFSTSPAKRCANFSTIFFKIIIFFIYKIYLYLICFIYFVYFKYTLSIYFYMNIIFT